MSGRSANVVGSILIDVSEPEEPLVGGDVTDGVVRVGMTVRRPTGSHSSTVHRVLRHLEDIGFDGAPRFVGVDGQGREILTYIEGQVAGRPWPNWVADPERAASVARLLRRLDDAMVPMGLPSDLAYEPGVRGPQQRAPYFLGHRDVTPENTVFRAGQAHAFIDFDFLRPSTRIQEVCNLLLWWGGWMPIEDREVAMRDIDATERGRLLVDAYGLALASRRLVVAAAIHSAERAWYSMRDRARTRGGGWARMWDEGIGDRIRRREQWLRANEALLHEALIA